MSLHWSWGLSTALILAVVIWLNGRQVRAGWLLGAAVQVINMLFGLAYGQWTFAFLGIPAVMFMINWWKHPRRVRPKPIKLPIRVRHLLTDGNDCGQPRGSEGRPGTAGRSRSADRQGRARGSRT